MKTWETVTMKLSELHPATYNPRKISERALEGLGNSLERFGVVQPVVWNKRTGNIVGGHQRCKALEAKGVTETEVVVVDLDDQEEVALNVALNNPEIQGEFDDKIEAVLKQIKEGSKDLFESLRMDDLAETLRISMGTKGKTPHDDVPPMPPSDKECDSKTGYVYTLGNHRLFVGDSTLEESVKALVAGKTMDMLLTDPPYNVDYQGGTKDAMKIANDSMPEDKFIAFLTAAFQAADTALKPGGVYYIWHACVMEYGFLQAARNAKWRLRQMLIWIKDRLVLGRNDYQFRHEPCLYGWKDCQCEGEKNIYAESHESAYYGWKDGAAHLWNTDRKQTTVMEFGKPAACDIHPCLTGDSLVLTDRGWREISSLSSGELVYGHDGLFHSVENVSSHRYVEPIYRLSVAGTNMSIDSTHNHPWLVCRRKKKVGLSKGWDAGFIEASDLKVGDYLMTPVLQGSSACPYSLDECFVIGLFLAEGSFQSAGHGENQYPRFSLHKDETELVDRIKRLGCNTSVYPSGVNGINVLVFDPEWGKKLEFLCGRGATQKTIAREVLTWSEPCRKAVVEGYLAGDGSKVRYYYSAKTSSFNLAAQMQLLGESVGFRVSCFKRTPKADGKIGDRRFQTVHPFYQLEFMSERSEDKASSRRIEWEGHSYVLRRLKKIGLCPFAGLVWNLTVEGSHTFQTVIGMSHNTMKPVELFKYLILNSTKAGQNVMDSFAGSGTTIIACEETDRNAFVLELSLQYSDVIRQRWAEFVHGRGCDWKALTPGVKA